MRRPPARRAIGCPAAAGRRRGVPPVVSLVVVGTTWLAGGGQSWGAEAPSESKAGQDVVPHVTRTGKPWIDMDYGPFLSATVELSARNIVPKGITIRLDPGPGGVSGGQEFITFDSDLLRWAGGWTGRGCIDWRNVAFDGSHQTHSAVRGDLVFETPVLAGWGRPGSASFDDPRVLGRDGNRYGPLPRDWAHWRGLYLFEDRVVLSYTVGGVPVLELPGSEPFGERRAITRTVELGPHDDELVLQVAGDPGERDLRWLTATTESGKKIAVVDGGGTAPIGVFDGRTAWEVARSDDFDLTSGDFTVTARILTTQDGSIFSKAPREGKWAPDGKTLFLRDGKLTYDIGWVGAISGARRVDDGEWHRVAMTYEKNGRIRLYVDGSLDGEGTMRPESRGRDLVVRLGYTSPDFPRGHSVFEGSISEVEFLERALEPREIAELPSAPEPPGAPSRHGLVARWMLDRPGGEVIEDASGLGHEARRIDPRGSATPPAVTVVALASGPAACEWTTGGGEGLRLWIPPARETVRLKILYIRAERDPDLRRYGIRAEASPAPEALLPLTRGAAGRWAETISTERSVWGSREGPYIVEDLGVPMENPYRSWMRPGGFDFFPDGRRAAVGTWSGDVWIVDGVGSDAKKLSWRRVATGLFQPLGLRIVGGKILVLGRDQITRLHDLNGDGEADWYENFSNDAQVTPHFHEFAMGLQSDGDGNLYYARGARHALDSVVPHHGTILRVEKDGSSTEIIANGFRAPNGLCVNGDGTFITSDQEGHWTPANRINWVRPGGFYGYMWSYHRGERPSGYEQPLCWMHPQCDRSPGAQLWVPRGCWGPLEGRLLSLSYGTGCVYHVLYEEVEGVIQGGVVKLPMSTPPTGIQRGRFHPADGQLYVCGLFGWSGDRTFPGGLYRIVATGKPAHVPLELHATVEGIVLRFTDALERRRAADPRRYAVERWNYRWAQEYGSKDYRVSDGSIGRDKVRVTEARVSRDGRSVFLGIPDMTPAMQMRIRYRLLGADKSRIDQEIYHTVHALGRIAPYRGWFD